MLVIRDRIFLCVWILLFSSSINHSKRIIWSNFSRTQTICSTVTTPCCPKKNLQTGQCSIETCCVKTSSGCSQLESRLNDEKETLKYKSTYKMIETKHENKVGGLDTKSPLNHCMRKVKHNIPKKYNKSSIKRIWNYYKVERDNQIYRSSFHVKVTRHKKNKANKHDSFNVKTYGNLITIDLRYSNKRILVINNNEILLRSLYKIF